MLEFWCIVLFVFLAVSSFWLIAALDSMLSGGEL